MLTDTDISVTDLRTLPVMEHFYTLQGEGRFAGQAAYFIRLGGCDVGCVWCDVKESWEADRHPQYTIQNLVAAVRETPAAIVVITGGEPLLHDLAPLTSALKAAGLRTHMETSGSSPLSGSWDWITLSPKKFKAPLPEVLAAAHELKVVIYHKSDFAWAEEHARQTGAGCLCYLQPEWSKAAAMTPLIVDYIKANPQWQLSVQVHKYINVP
ncbi:MAG TPA: 7-carboxy-7-deazaguanine synthase QueE [Chitinophagaceae bacterium]|jgi:organic radical activating enzyme|nr:7-carboxy-7-deazaguanine synthase QueE [Chitinophagaceae bacterium]